MKPNREREQEQKRLLLGVGLDGQDGHTRVTQGDSSMLVGGSQETHEKMQETVIKLGERLDRKGKNLQSASLDEVRDIIHDIQS